tara:strand:+ start:358 stop:570 length:213 start_codon:yes stop_codon:yes gene_type:complete
LNKYGRNDTHGSLENLRSNQYGGGSNYTKIAPKRDLSLPSNDYFSRNYAAKSSIENPYQTNKIYERNDAI